MYDFPEFELDDVDRKVIGDIADGKSPEYLKGYVAGINDELMRQTKELIVSHGAMRLLRQYISEREAQDVSTV